MSATQAQNQAPLPTVTHACYHADVLERREGRSADSMASSSASSVQLRRLSSSGAACTADANPPTPSVSWGHAAAEEPRHGSQPPGSTLHAGAHSREARAAFLLQHGWADQQQPLSQPVPGLHSGDPHKASARFGSPIQMDPHWHPSREVRMPARPPPSVVTGAATTAGVPGAAASAQPSASGLSASGSSAASQRPQRDAQRYHLPGQLSSPSDWDVARAAATPGSVNQPAAAPRTSRCCSASATTADSQMSESMPSTMPSQLDRQLLSCGSNTGGH